MFNRIDDYLSKKLWPLNSEDLGKGKGLAVKSIKIILITVRDFFNDKCMVKASSLTYYTLLAVVPLAAVVFTVLKLSGIQNTYAAPFLSKVFLNPEAAERVIGYVNSTDVGALGLAGAFFLLFTSIILLANIEKALNDIWGIKEKRAIVRKLIYYLIAIIVLPVIITVGFSVTLSFIKKAIPSSLTVLPYIITFTGFTVLYLYFPNVKVKIKASAAAAVISTVLWYVAQSAFIFWSRSIAKFNIIYGSFSQVVLGFIWIYISWLVILIGSEMSFAVQNYKTYKKEDKSGNISFSFKERLALIITAVVYKNAKEGQSRITAQGLIEITGGPIKLINEILLKFTKINIFSEKRRRNNRYISPGRDVDKVTVKDVLAGMKNYGINKISLKDTDIKKEVYNITDKIENLTDTPYGDIPVADL